MKRGIVIFCVEGSLKLLSFQKNQEVLGIESLPFQSDEDKDLAWEKILSLKSDVIEIQNLESPVLRAFTLPAKDRGQLELMVSQQVKLLSMHGDEGIHEIIPSFNQEVQHLSAFLINFKGNYKSIFREGQFKGKNWLGLSSCSSVLLSHLEEHQNEDADIFHIRDSWFYHIIIRGGLLFNVRIRYAGAEFLGEDFFLNTLQESYRVLNIKFPTRILVWTENPTNLPGTYEIDGGSLDVIEKTISRDEEAMWLMTSVIRALESDKVSPRIVFGKRMIGQSKQKSSPWALPVLCSLLLLVTVWTTGFLRLEKFQDYSSRLYDELKELHQETLEPGKRRHFTEISFIKRLKKEAQNGSDDHQEGSSFRDFLSQLQTTLKDCPKFIFQRVQGQPQGGIYKVQGIVDDVRAFDALSQEFGKNPDWIVKANFTRSSGRIKGLRVNLSIEVKP